MNNIRQHPSSQRQSPKRQAVKLIEASRLSGQSVDALRKRVSRGGASHGYKGNDGKWRVYVRSEWSPQKGVEIESSQQRSVAAKVQSTAVSVQPAAANVQDELIKEKDKTISILTGQLDEKDQMIHQLIAKIPNQTVEVDAMKKELEEMKTKLADQQSIVKRAWKILRQQLQAV